MTTRTVSNPMEALCIAPARMLDDCAPDCVYPVLLLLISVSDKEHAFRVGRNLKGIGLVDGIFCTLDRQALVHLGQRRGDRNSISNRLNWQ